MSDGSHEYSAAGLRAGAAADLEAVYRAHLGDVMTLLQGGFGYNSGGERKYLRVRSAFDAEELCQEAFAAFYRQCAAGRFDANRPVRPYLRRIAANLALKKLGRASRETLLADPEPLVAASDDSPERMERARLAREYSASLGEPDKTILQRYFVDGDSQQAIANALSLSRDQVYRIVTKLRRDARRFFSRRGITA